MRSPTSPLEQQPTTINLYEGLGFLPEFSTTKQMADEFTNQLFHRLEGCCGMMRSSTTPYHSKGIGKKERLNQTLLSMFRTSPENQKSRWKDSLNNLYMLIIAPVMRPLDSFVISCCVVRSVPKTSDSSYFRIKPASPTEYSAYVRE